MKWAKRYWPLGLIIGVELILFFLHVTPGISLLGWDGLYPELNFPINLQRNIFAIWQEYRGVGLYDGMSYASNLVHTLFLWGLSFLLPQNFLRYTFIFLMHGLGMVGMYFLLKKLFPPTLISHNSLPKTHNYVVLFGALFYGLNLGIIQLFYAPLEVFAIHFAVLPFAVLTLFSFLHDPTLKKLLPFAIVSFLATPQGYVPQIFISYLLVIASILGVYFWVNRKQSLPAIGKVLATIFVTNAFWLLPYIYGIPHNAGVIMNSKINQMASNKIYLMNRARGDFWDVITMKGFMLDTAEFSHNQYGYIMQDWRNYTSSPFFIFPSLIFAILTLIGIVRILYTRQLGFYPFVIVGSASFFFLGNDVWGLNILNALLRFLLPTFNEAFRFPFTKFETIFVFSYTVLLTVGIFKLSERMTRVEVLHFLKHLYKKISQIFLSSLRVRLNGRSNLNNIAIKQSRNLLLPTVLFLSLLLYCLPVFQGHFLFDGVRVTMEPEYQDVISYLNTPPQTTRVATLPQPTFYNWEYHANNYRGSGFLWYGIPQAMLERSFDPWSNYNENYYWELSQALYSNNPTAVKNVFAKYQVGLVLLDENRIYPFAPQSLQLTTTKQLLSDIGAKKLKQFGKVTLYKLPSNPLFVADNLPTVNAYTWTDTDTFYQLHGNYIASDSPDFTLPFRSLFSNRPQKDNQFSVSQTPTTISFHATLPAGTSHIILPSYTTLEPFIQGTLVYEKNTHILSFVLQTPKILVAGQALSGQTLSYPLATLPDSPAFPLRIQVNTNPSVILPSDNNTTLASMMLPTSQDTFVTIQDSQQGEITVTLPHEKIQETFGKPLSITLSGAKTPFPLDIVISKEKNFFHPAISTAPVGDCDTTPDSKNQTVKAIVRHNSLSLTAVHADACLSFFDSQAQSSQGYLLSLDSHHVSGEPLFLWAEDPSQEYTFLYTQLNTATQTATYIIPPRENFHLGYSFHIENISTGNDLTQNELTGLSLFPIPYQFLTHILSDTGKNPHGVTTQSVDFDHPNPSLYTVTNLSNSSPHTTLVLSQAYDTGWHAYEIRGDGSGVLSPLEELFPFLFGTELTNHVKVNNWENGWQLTSQLVTPHSSLIIVFLPQYLEYLGFGIFGGVVFFILGYWLLRNMQHRQISHS